MSGHSMISEISFMSKNSFTTDLICDEFPIKIRSLTGKETLTRVHHKMIVSELKNMIEKIDQTPFDQQRLVYNGKQLEDNRTLDYYGVNEESVIHIILRIRGGMFHETSARKDYGLVQYACMTESQITQSQIARSQITQSWQSQICHSIEELEEKIRLLKMNQ